jgi:hypothetical protein
VSLSLLGFALCGISSFHWKSDCDAFIYHLRHCGHSNAIVYAKEWTNPGQESCRVSYQPAPEFPPYRPPDSGRSRLVGGRRRRQALVHDIEQIGILEGGGDALLIVQLLIDGGLAGVCAGRDHDIDLKAAR